MLNKKFIGILFFIFIILMNFTAVLSVNITNCKSDSIDWLCERDRPCICKTTSDCTDGNLLVYEDSIDKPVCSPQISDGSSSVDWSICKTTQDYVKIRADCNEGQSSEKTLVLTGAAVTTTIGVTTTTYSGEYTGSCGGEGYCESTDFDCLGDYEDCSIYDSQCQSNQKCCCPIGGTTPEPKKKSGFNYWWIVLILVIIGLAALVYFFYIKKGHREEQIKKAFRDLYQKWGT